MIYRSVKVVIPLIDTLFFEQKKPNKKKSKRILTLVYHLFNMGYMLLKSK